MSVAFTKGQQLGPNDLDVNLENSSSYPINAAEISYGLYYVTDTGQEVLLGVPRRDPVNDSVGHYYASLIIPLDANIGDYRVRWAFRETVGGSIHNVVQEFAVVDKNTNILCPITSQHEADLIRRLRIMLRDNCVGGEELVKVKANDELIKLSLQELYDITQDKEVFPQYALVKKAWEQGTLSTLSVSPGGVREYKKIQAVQRVAIGVEKVLKVTTPKGYSFLTAGHRVFISPTDKLETRELKEGSRVLSPSGDVEVSKVNQVATRKYMYDLTVEDWHNFVLVNSGMVVSNCPDRNYHFRPPAHEETIRQFNKVFGYIWEDLELQEFLQNGLDVVSAAPPRTPIPSFDILYSNYPEWKTLVLSGAMMYALFALQINWIADEFDYSIGGVSLSIEKSSKYESAYQAIKDQFDGQLERAKQTVKIIRGLQQPKYGIGVRSSFGPASGAGVLTPRKFVGF